MRLRQGVTYLGERSPYPSMTRGAVEQGFERFLEDMIEVAYREFDVTSALRNGTRGGVGASLTNRLVKNSNTLERLVVRPELQSYRRDVMAQFDVILDYAADDAGVEAYREEFLAHDSYYEALRDSIPRQRYETIEARLVDRAAALGDAAEPLIDAEEAEFWPAVRAELTHEEAHDLIDRHFRFTRPVGDDEDAFEFVAAFEAGDVVGSGGLGSLLGGTLPEVEVEFTDEALRVMRRAEEEVVREATREVDRRFEDE